MARAYYNEIDRDAVAILRQLIANDVIAPGDVDDRDIRDVQPADLAGYTQCHFFAGGGLWSVAGRLAGWPDDRPLWTGSCPCQPFSTAGRGGGVTDPRHLWPDFFRLIRAARPPVVVGEQVAGSAGYGWFDRVGLDLASENYAGRGIDIPACAVDAPHIRSRLYWLAVGDAPGDGRQQGFARPAPARYGREPATADQRDDGAVVDPEGFGRRKGRPKPEFWCGRPAAAEPDLPDRTEGVATGHPSGARQQERERPAVFREGRRQERGAAGQPDRAPRARNGSWWAGAEWLHCADGKARRAQPGIRLLVDGLPGRVGLWRVAGNAISPILAAEVIAAFLDTEQAERAERLRLIEHLGVFG